MAPSIDYFDENIAEIIKVEPFMVTCKWTTGEVRVVDLGSAFGKWTKEGQTLLNSLSDYERFKYVTINQSKTLCWPTITFALKDIHGKTKDEILDLDPDVLYQISLPIEDFKLVRAA